MVSSILNSSRYLINMLPNLVFSSLHFGSFADKHLYLYTDSKYLTSLCKVLFLHHNFQCKSLSDIVGVDFIEKKNRFQVIYNLLSLNYHSRHFLVVWTNELSTIPSIVPLYPCASWYEREVWDLLGIHFSNNNDLRRILTDYGFVGHPLRKDFPLTGFVELFYNYKIDSIVYREISLVQEYRNFDTTTPWDFYYNTRPQLH